MSTGTHQKAIFGDTIKYVPATLIRVFASVLILPLLTRYFDAELYGKYVFAISILTFLQIFVGSWINSTILRFYAHSEIRQETHILADSILMITLVSSILISLIEWLIIILLKPYIDDTLFILLVLIPFVLITSSIADLPLQTFRVQRKIGFYSLFMTVRTVFVPLIGIIISHMLGGAIVGLVVGSIVTQVIVVIIAYKICYQNISDIPRLNHFKREYARELIAFGLPIVPTMIFYTILDISDRFILNAFHGSRALGVYAVNYTISWTIISLIGTVVSQSSDSIIVSTWEKEGRTSVERIINTLLRTYLTIGIPSVIGLTIISSQLSELLVAQEYLDGVVIYPYIASSALLMGIQWIAQRGLILSNQTNLLLKLFFVGSLCNILLNIAFIPSFGYTGAAIATLIAVILLTGLIAYYSARYITISVDFLSIGRIFTACIVMMIVSQGIPDFGDKIINIAVKCTISCMVYGFSLIILKEWHINDLSSILRSFRIIH